jgi:hypothetical protein
VFAEVLVVPKSSEMNNYGGDSEESKKADFEGLLDSTLFGTPGVGLLCFGLLSIDCL